MENEKMVVLGLDNSSVNQISNLIDKKLLKLMVLFVLSMLAVLKWEAATVAVMYILIHEGGHIWAMLRLNVEIAYLKFMPFLGAGVMPKKDYFPLRKEEVEVAIMGPAFGLASVLVVLAAWIYSGNVFFVLAGSMVNVFNLFNLLPAGVMDGGRIFRSIILSIDKRTNWICHFLTFIISIVSVVYGFLLVTLIMILMEFQLKAVEESEYFREIKVLNKKEIYISAGAYAAVLIASIWIYAYTMDIIGGFQAFEELFIKWW